MQHFSQDYSDKPLKVKSVAPVLMCAISLDIYQNVLERITEIAQDVVKKKLILQTADREPECLI